jgi:TP901-1 family phage major tail protein
MAKKAGRLMRIKLGNDASPQSFTTIAGAREDSLSINNSEIDITDKDDMPWKTLLEGGIQSVSISCSGLLETDRPGIVSAPDMIALALAATIRTYQFVMDGMGTFEGEFQIRSYEPAGSHEAAGTFSASFESSGPITFTAS